jgi:hypothetical protein
MSYFVPIAVMLRMLDFVPRMPFVQILHRQCARPKRWTSRGGSLGSSTWMVLARRRHCGASVDFLRGVRIRLEAVLSRLSLRFDLNE